MKKSCRLVKTKNQKIEIGYRRLQSEINQMTISGIPNCSETQALSNRKMPTARAQAMAHE